MGVLQQGFNQALTGATFLLQQTPWWHGRAETQEQFKRIKNLDKNLSGLAKSASVEGKMAEINTSPDNKYTTEKEASDSIARAEMFSNRYRATQNEIDVKTSENPSLEKKYKRWKAGQNNEESAVRERAAVIRAELQTERAKQSLMELQNQYTNQKESQDSLKEELKISKKDADELAKRGIGKEAIKGAKYN